MSRRSILSIFFIIVIGSVCGSIRVVEVEASGTIYIRADGSIDPPTTLVETSDNVTYNFTNNIIGKSVRVERDNITINGNGYMLQGDGTGIGFNLDDRNRITIQSVLVRNFTIGISVDVDLGYTIRNIIRNNVISENQLGIFLYFSHWAFIFGNMINGNGNGIGMISCGDGSLQSNNITNNQVGIDMHTCHSWDIFHNSITENGDGITMVYSWHIDSDPSWFSVIHHNNFINNTHHISPMYSENIYDMGYPSGGNYWSDFNVSDVYSGSYQNESGSDGISDVPFVYDDWNQDRYPLVNPYWSPGDFNRDMMINIYDAVIIANAYGSSASDPRWNALCDLVEAYGVIDIFDVVFFCTIYGQSY